MINTDMVIQNIREAFGQMLDNAYLDDVKDSDLQADIEDGFATIETELAALREQVKTLTAALEEIEQRCSAFDDEVLFDFQVSPAVETIGERARRALAAVRDGKRKGALLSTYQNDTTSEIPCAICGGEVVEFSIPNDIWNKVIRPDGHEHDKEYLCMNCFFDALRSALALKAVKNTPAKHE